MVGDQGLATVRRVHYDCGQEVDRDQYTEMVPVDGFERDPRELARVRVGGGLTQNVREMNFVKLDVSCELPCYAELSEMERAYAFAAGFVHDRLARELEIALEKEQEVAGEPSAQAQPEWDDNGSGIRPVLLDT